MSLSPAFIAMQPYAVEMIHFSYVTRNTLFIWFVGSELIPVFRQSAHRWLSNIKLLLLLAAPLCTERHCHLTNQLHCLVTEGYVCEQLPQRITGWPKNWHRFFGTPLTSSNIKLFHFQNQEKICNNTITKDPTTPQLCRYTTLWNVKAYQKNCATFGPPGICK